MARCREAARAAIAHCQWIAAQSEDPGRTTRTFLSPPMREVHGYLRTWMETCGLSVHVDAAGNLRGSTGVGPTVLIVSHLDTVPNAGAYDGVLGVVIGITLAELLADRALPFRLEVVGCSEEEGVRFGVPFIGSRALIGNAEAMLPLTDRTGRSVREAIEAYGLDPSHLQHAAVQPSTPVACLEFHIEQGPVLEELDLPLGLVETIVGQSRVDLTFTGQANHAGTTPMPLRRDALAGAAEWVGEVERTSTSVPGLMATVGCLQPSPNVSNAVNGLVRASLDVRHAEDGLRRKAVDHLLAAARVIAERRSLMVSHTVTLDQPAVRMAPTLVDRLAASCTATGHPVHRMSSGAGHDAMILAPAMPTSLVFLRSPGGVSHHPDERVLVDDVAAALAVGMHFLTHWEPRGV